MFRYLRDFVDLCAWTENSTTIRETTQGKIWNAILDSWNRATESQNRQRHALHNNSNQEPRLMVEGLAWREFVENMRNICSWSLDVPNTQEDDESDEWIEFGRGWTPRGNSRTSKARLNSTYLSERKAIEDVPLLAPRRDNMSRGGSLSLERFIFGDSLESPLRRSTNSFSWLRIND
jgi:hypothetical protein